MSSCDWVEWFLYRLHQEPWALGGFVVIGVFVLGILSLVTFALLYGCCCSPKENQKKNTPLLSYMFTVL
uniref:Small integral membrane protein 18 n=1 Tax=Sander lucioperca TaxID=283035 RepID=A0A8D0DCI9_SANLU